MGGRGIGDCPYLLSHSFFSSNTDGQHLCTQQNLAASRTGAGLALLKGSKRRGLMDLKKRRTGTKPLFITKNLGYGVPKQDLTRTAQYCLDRAAWLLPMLRCRAVAVGMPLPRLGLCGLPFAVTLPTYGPGRLSPPSHAGNPSTPAQCSCNPGRYMEGYNKTLSCCSVLQHTH